MPEFLSYAIHVASWLSWSVFGGLIGMLVAVFAGNRLFWVHCLFFGMAFGMTGAAIVWLVISLAVGWDNPGNWEFANLKLQFLIVLTLYHWGIAAGLGLVGLFKAMFRAG